MVMVVRFCGYVDIGHIDEENRDPIRQLLSPTLILWPLSFIWSSHRAHSTLATKKLERDLSTRLQEPVDTCRTGLPR